MLNLTFDLEKNIAEIDKRLCPEKSFDLIKREMEINGEKIIMYYVDGFVTSAIMQKLIMHMTTIKSFGNGEEGEAEKFARTLPSVEVDTVYDVETLITQVLSGCSAILAKGFGNGAIIVDARSYPARQTEEPGNDRVMRGARDGFVETLIFNTAMIRRRIRSPELRMKYISVGEVSKTDVCVAYLDKKADPVYVNKIIDKISKIKTDALPMGHQSLIECLIKKKSFFNPFPRVRCTERPDCACASILEGSIIILCDTSPEAIILPTSIFDFLQDTDDYYFTPITGSYLRLVRQFVFWSAVVLTPVWYFLVTNPQIVPEWLYFVVPNDTGAVPILIQLLLVEFVIDGLKLASLNTPSVMSNSFGVIGGLLLGDFAVEVGWLSPDVIFYMAIVSMASFTQSNYELGYALKFVRIITLCLVALLGGWGLLLGALIGVILIVTTKTINGNRSYLYPLIPLNLRALSRLIFRRHKEN